MAPVYHKSHYDDGSDVNSPPQKIAQPYMQEVYPQELYAPPVPVELEAHHGTSEMGTGTMSGWSGKTSTKSHGAV